MADERKIVAVLGATGQQGGSVVRQLLLHSERYSVRALTRNPGSSNAQNLVNIGAEVRKADLDEPESFEGAFEGAHLVYAMTDFWQTMSAEIEEAQGRALIDFIATMPHLEHLIWASLPDARSISEGKFSNVFHWQSKAAVTSYIRGSKPEVWNKTTAVMFPNYFENCLTSPERYLPVKRNGIYVRSFPLSAPTTLPNVAIEDTGKLIEYIFDHGDIYKKKEIAFFSQDISELEKLEAIGNLYKIPVEYHKMTAEEFQETLKDMQAVTALDFTEQLMIFESCGPIYQRSEFIQANKLPGLKLTTWEEFIASHNMLSYIVNNASRVDAPRRAPGCEASARHNTQQLLHKIFSGN